MSKRSEADRPESREEGGLPPEARVDGTERPEAAQSALDRSRRWWWVEHSVWTDRMLAALDAGVKGGKWHSLWDKVTTHGNLFAAYLKVAANGGAAGVDRMTVEMFGGRLLANVERLIEQLRAGTYRPQAVKRVYIPKPGSRDKRPLGIPTVRDRVVQGALRHGLEPIFERDFAEHSYGFRPGRGCKDALRRVDGLLRDGQVWVVDADIKGYFDAIAHDRLMALLRRKVADGSVLRLVEAYLNQRVLDGLEEWTPEIGTPQGAVLSPLLANVYLDPLDHLLASRGLEMTRYADDFVVQCRTREEAESALATIREWTEENRLQLHPEKTRVVNAAEPGGFDFLGYHFERGYRWPRDKSLKKIRDAIRAKTPRKHGASMRVIVQELNPTLRGWFEYFKHSARPVFSRLDRWIRMRLRSILRKRHKGKGRGRGRDHIRWPNAYFAELGLFSLAAARDAASRSARR